MAARIHNSEQDPSATATPSNNEAETLMPDQISYPIDVSRVRTIRRRFVVAGLAIITAPAILIAGVCGFNGGDKVEEASNTDALVTEVDTQTQAEPVEAEEAEESREVFSVVSAIPPVTDEKADPPANEVEAEEATEEADPPANEVEAEEAEAIDGSITPEHNANDEEEDDPSAGQGGGSVVQPFEFEWPECWVDEESGAIEAQLSVLSGSSADDGPQNWQVHSIISTAEAVETVAGLEAPLTFKVEILGLLGVCFGASEEELEDARPLLSNPTAS